MAFHSDFRGGKSRLVTNTYYVKSTKVLLVKRHIACPNRTDLCENYGLPSYAVRELYRLKKKKNMMADSRMDCLRGCLATLSVLLVRIAPLEYSKIHEKAYKVIVCEFGGFQNVLRDARVRAPSLHRESTDSLIDMSVFTVPAFN